MSALLLATSVIVPSPSATRNVFTPVRAVWSMHTCVPAPTARTKPSVRLAAHTQFIDMDDAPDDGRGPLSVGSSSTLMPSVPVGSVTVTEADPADPPEKVLYRTTKKYSSVPAL